MKKVGRNDFCPCGSGKKYKQCCLPDSAPESVSSPSLLQIAFEHRVAGRLDQAELVYRQILRADPHNGEALRLLGIVAHELGDNDTARQLIGQAIVETPLNVQAHNDLGGLLHLLGKLEEAAVCFRHALSLAPLNAQAHYNLGCVLHGQGKLDEAEISYRQALSINPDAADILCNLGGCLQEQGKAEAAIACYRQALALNPDDIKSINNLGVSLQTNGQAAEAIACFERTIATRPDYAQTYVNLGMTFNELGEVEKALSYYRQALEIDPHYAYARFCIGVALQVLCKPEEALNCYRQALEFKGDNSKAYDNLLMLLPFVPNTTQEETLIAHQRFGEQFETALKPLWPAHSNRRDPDRRLKIGYVSGDFRMHAVAYFIEPVFAGHDKSQVEVFCYSNSDRHDIFTDRLIAYADHWQPCLSMSDDRLAERIRADGIDILVDLSGHTAYNRLLAFARKPAPVQITYLGYPGTSGLSAMDYRLTDHYTEPAGNERYYTEKLLRMPDSMWCYRPDEGMQEVTPLPALANGYLTFGSFNNINKVGNECIALWASLLRSLPTARLLMVTVPEGETRERLTRQFLEHGAAPGRIDFCGKLPPSEFQRMLQQVDITLDPFPINGATTTCESLWLGVPVLAMVGDRFLSRAGLSVLSAAKLPDFAATTTKDFLNTAALLANNLPLLASIRAGLREHLVSTPLLDQTRFTFNLERIYRNVWSEWCAASKHE